MGGGGGQSGGYPQLPHFPLHTPHPSPLFLLALSLLIIDLLACSQFPMNLFYTAWMTHEGEGGSSAGMSKRGCCTCICGQMTVGASCHPTLLFPLATDGFMTMD